MSNDGQRAVGKAGDKQDEVWTRLLQRETEHQNRTLSLIASENIVSENVRRALGSALTHKYAEGYPGARYYQGTQIVDEIENLAINRAKALFGVPFANVQAYSGSPANFAIYRALTTLTTGGLLAMALNDGGHLTHGASCSATARMFDRVIAYHVDPQTNLVDYDALEQTAKLNHPRVIVCGGSAYAKQLDFARFGKIADSVGAWLVADVSHVAGLIAGGAYASPVA